MQELTDKLVAIDQLLSVKMARTAKELQPGADAATVAKLAPLFGDTIPADITAWFAWHDGRYASLDPESNYMLMSVDDVVEAHEFLCSPDEDILQPYKPTWIPLLSNGAGDHVVYDRDSGSLLEWRHDDEDRPAFAASLEAYAGELLTALEKAKPPTAVPSPWPIHWSTLTAVPSKTAELAQAAVGTTYYRAIPEFKGGYKYRVYVKLGADEWLSVFGRSPDLGNTDEAFTLWASFVQVPPSKTSGYYVSDSDVTTNLRTAKQGLVMIGTRSAEPAGH